MIHKVEANHAGRALSIETGRFAEQASGSVTIRCGDTILLVTVTGAKPREGIDFFPLSVDVEEKYYAVGRIPGGYLRREGRPSDDCVLAARLCDRPLRPLFPKDYRNEVQVIITILSSDQENATDVMGIVGASAALCISDIPFGGPVGAVRVGRINGEFVINPQLSQFEESDLDLVIAGTKDAVMMVEAEAGQLPETEMLAALERGQDALQETIAMQEELISQVSKAKHEYVPHGPPDELVVQVQERVAEQVAAAFGRPDKAEREEQLAAITADTVAALGEEHGQGHVADAVQSTVKKHVRNEILHEGKRPDGRGPAEIRPLSAEVGVLPRTHGTGLFQRGQTQALSITTLGSIGDAQPLYGLEIADSKPFIHHYNFPPFSTGEVGRLGSPRRREIGHGRLAERAVAQVLPSQEEFPYTIRVVSEVLSSNGSTSMASTCGSTLALMDAGVPIKAPVGGIAMGLVMGDEGEYAILTDIQGIEDALGDMDFKVAGTTKGVTALQMDIKVSGITFAIMEQALAQARDARLEVLNVMAEAIAEPRTELSDYAPKLVSLKINPEKIGDVIGPGGKIIRKIQEETESKIDIDDDGTIVVTGDSKEGVDKAVETIRNMTTELEVGAIFTGTVSRIMNAGVFVNLPDGRREGLVRMSELAEDYVERAEDIADVGDEVMVMVIEIDYQGRVNLSRRAVLEGTHPSERPQSSRGDRGGDRGGERGRGPSDRRGPPRGGRGPRRYDRERSPAGAERGRERGGDREARQESSDDSSSGSSGRKW